MILSLVIMFCCWPKKETFPTCIATKDKFKLQFEYGWSSGLTLSNDCQVGEVSIKHTQLKLRRIWSSVRKHGSRKASTQAQSVVWTETAGKATGGNSRSAEDARKCTPTEVSLCSSFGVIQTKLEVKFWSKDDNKLSWGEAACHGAPQKEDSSKQKLCDVL